MGNRIIALVVILFYLTSCNPPQNSNLNQSNSPEILDTTQVVVSEIDSMVHTLKQQELKEKKKIVRVNRKKRPKVEYVYIGGIFLDKPDKTILFERKNKEEGAESKTRFSVSDDNTFGDTVKLNMDGYYAMKFRGRNYDMFLSPGDSIGIQIDLENKEHPIVFSGTGSGVNNYLRSRIQMDYDLSMKKRHLFKLAYGDFSDTLIHKRQQLLSHLKDSRDTIADITSSFYKKEQSYLNIDWAQDHIDYKALASKYGSSTYWNRIQEYNMDFIEDLDLDDPNFLLFPKFRKLLTDYFGFRVDGIVEREVPGNPTLGMIITGRHTKKYDLIGKYFKNKEVAAFLKKEVVKSLIMEDGTPTMNPLIIKFLNEVDNKAYQDTISTYVQKYAYIDDGSMAPDFAVTDPTGIVKKLSDFKGKYVYIDVWASWCGPCKHEIPYFNQLKEEYKTKNIEFISISIDNTKEPWKRVLADWNLSGNQFFVDGAWNSVLAKSYHLKGLPQFILIDPEGQIVDLSAARPSGRIRDDLNRLNF